MEEALDTLHLIDESQLHPQFYTVSLLQQAVLCQLLSEGEVAGIQADLFRILAEQCDKWNRGESSSIPTEKAQDMVISILFVISMKLKTCPSPEQAIQVIKTEPLRALFEGGLQIVQRRMAVSKFIHHKIVENLLETPNVYYRSTIVDGIRGFFMLYRPQFSAQEIHITADYPVFAGRPELDGIEFIEKYLRCVEAENDFCVQFHAKDIHQLLCGLTQDYRSVPMNLFEYVILSTIGLVLQNRDPRRLNLRKQDVDGLYSLFSDRSDEELKESLENAVLVLNQQDLLPKSTKRYLEVTLQRLVPVIRNAVKMKTLDKLFLVPANPEQTGKMPIFQTEKAGNTCQ